MDVIFLVNIFDFTSKKKLKFFHDDTRKNLFLRACYCWDGTISFRQVDQNFLHSGKTDYGNSYLDSVFRSSKVFILDAILHDGAGTVRIQTGKGPGLCYIVS